MARQILPVIDDVKDIKLTEEAEKELSNGKGDKDE